LKIAGDISKQVLRVLGASGDDLLVIAGFFSLVYGAHCIYRPASFVVAGILLIAGGLNKMRGSG